MDISVDKTTMLLLPWMLLAFVFNLFLPAICKNITQDVVTCPVTEASAHAFVIPCLRRGEKFLKRYFKRYNKNSFDKCKEFHEFEACINPRLERCPDVVSHMPYEWLNAVQLFTCACSEHDIDTTACDGSLSCMARELEGVFSQRCEERFQLNKQQGTLSQCHFLHDYIYCKESIVTSACGRQAGTLLFLVHRVAAWQSFSCDVTHIDDYQGFRYSDECPVGLAEEIDSCLDSTLKRVLKFNPDNDLIPIDGEDDVRKACAAYRAYSDCLDDWRERCPLGVTMAMEQNEQLRVYLLKMRHICEDAGADYIPAVGCYQEVMERDSLSVCFPIWEHIEPLMTTLTPHEYYCVADSLPVLHLKAALRNLTACYGSVLGNKCGEKAGLAMEGLIAKAFQDPVYLRLDYEPDCYLHSRVPYDTPPTKKPPKDKTNKLRHHQYRKNSRSESSNGQARPNTYEPSPVRKQPNGASTKSLYISSYLFWTMLHLIYHIGGISLN